MPSPAAAADLPNKLPIGVDYRDVRGSHPAPDIDPEGLQCGNELPRLPPLDVQTLETVAHTTEILFERVRGVINREGEEADS